MAGVPAKRRFNLAKVDDWAAVLQWTGERAFALVASTVGAGVIGYAAKATTWIAQYGPIAWAGLGVVSFLGIYWLMIIGRRILASARVDRATAMIAERVAEHATVNPLADDFRNQHIRMVDLYTPMGAPLTERTFRRCDLIGPAVLWLSPHTKFTSNVFNNVEFIKINAETARGWPNKLALVGGSIHECHLVNVIILVHDEHGDDFQRMFNDKIQWMNDPIPPAEARLLPSPQDTGSEKHQ